MAMKKKQGFNARLDESMGARSGRKRQSEKSRRNESEGMEKAMGRRKFAAAGTMDKGRKRMAEGGMAYGKPKKKKKMASGGMMYGDKKMAGGGIMYGEPKKMAGGGLMIDTTKMRMAEGGMAKKGKFPDLTGDGKVTRADILKGRGVKKMARGGLVTMASSNTTVRGPHGGNGANASNTNMRKLNAMGKMKG